MKRSLWAPRSVDSIREYRVSEKLTSIDFMVHPRHIHANHPTRPDVQVSDLGISHDTGRQADTRTMRFEQCAWIFFTKLVVERCLSERNGVAVATGTVSPAVDYD